jgi:acetylornithine deacetylase/succinyl-diaminopimelate desuccinylase-like protein
VRELIDLAGKLIAFDSRSSVSNLPLVEFLEDELADFTLERVTYFDPAGVEKAALVACAGPAGKPRIALSGHLDTVPPAGWSRDPFLAEVVDGRLFGLGASDMKGPVAAAITAARVLAEKTAVMLLLTTDEETTKEGARRVVDASSLVATDAPVGIIVVEPTSLRCVRGHRVDIKFEAVAHGRQAHSSTAAGSNANLRLIPFLAEMRGLHLELRQRADLQDPAYDPSWCDLNIVVDNHGAAPNVTVGRATCRMKFRYSKAIDPSEIVERVRSAAATQGLELDVRREAPPPELDPAHPLVEAAVAVTGRAAHVVGFGTDASELTRAAPCIVLGPGSIDDAHRPDESIALAELEAGVSTLVAVGRRAAERLGSEQQIAHGPATNHDNRNSPAKSEP